MVTMPEDLPFSLAASVRRGNLNGCEPNSGCIVSAVTICSREISSITLAPVRAP